MNHIPNFHCEEEECSSQAVVHLHFQIESVEEPTSLPPTGLKIPIPRGIGRDLCSIHLKRRMAEGPHFDSPLGLCQDPECLQRKVI
mgnify:CR=1 FL=1